MKFVLFLFLSFTAYSHAENNGTNIKEIYDNNGTIKVETPFQRDENGTVLDTGTGLQWQDDYSDQDGKIRHSHYMEASAYCSELILNGASDWRLPSKDELLSIIGKSDFSNTKVFLHSVASHYWSNTPYSEDPYYNLVVNFEDGSTHKLDPWYAAHVRCVRDNK